MVAAQIADGLSRAQELRIEYAAMLAYREAEHARRQVALARPGGADGLEAAGAFVAQQKSNSDADDRRIALRKGRGEVPWLSGIKLSWGPELQLVNISSSGVLVESGSKFAPGSTTELHLSGPETNLVVPVRFTRSAVARIDGLGVRYHAAAAFAKELDLAGPRRADAPVTPPQELASLLGSVFATANERSEPAHARFARRTAPPRRRPRRTGADGVRRIHGWTRNAVLRGAWRRPVADDAAGRVRPQSRGDRRRVQGAQGRRVADRRRPRAREARQPAPPNRLPELPC